MNSTLRLVSATCLVLPLSSFAQEGEPPKTGSGDGVYQVVRAWPQYPEGTALGNLHGDMAADRSGNVYIATAATIQVIGPDGKFVRDLGPEWGGVHGMKVREEGGEEFLFVAQNGKKAVSKLTLDGTAVWQILGPPKKGELYEHISKYNPTDVDIAPDGRIYVADGYGMSLMHIFDKDRKYVKSFGGKGAGDGQFDVCHNVLVDPRGADSMLLISDRQNNRLQLYTADGDFVRTIDDELGRPCAADIHGELLAVAELDGRVSLYGAGYALISRLGDEPADRKKAGNGIGPEDWHEGGLIAVHGCTFDAEGDLYAQEWNVHGRVTKYTKVD